MIVSFLNHSFQMQNWSGKTYLIMRELYKIFWKRWGWKKLIFTLKLFMQFQYFWKVLLIFYKYLIPELCFSLVNGHLTLQLKTKKLHFLSWMNKGSQLPSGYDIRLGIGGSWVRAQAPFRNLYRCGLMVIASDWELGDWGSIPSLGKIFVFWICLNESFLWYDYLSQDWLLCRNFI